MCFDFLKKPVKTKDFDIDIEPESDVEAEWDDIINVITAKFPEVTQDQIFLSDKDYTLASYNDIAKFLAQDDTNRMGYHSNDRDCDDFSYRLMGQFSIPKWSDICLGILWTDKHAMNFVIDEDSNFWFLEPQSDILSDTLDPRKGTEFVFFMV